MNFLEIAKRVRQECGISGDGPTNVAGQIGIYAKIVNWVQVAHEEIQRRSDAWNFDWAEHSQPLTAGVESYHPATDWGLECKRIDGNGLYVFTTANGPNAKTWVPLVDWATFRTMRRVKAQPAIGRLRRVDRYAPGVGCQYRRAAHAGALSCRDCLAGGDAVGCAR